MINCHSDVSLAAFLQENPKAAENFRAVAGLSLGEYTALCPGPTGPSRDPPASAKKGKVGSGW